MQVFQTWTKEDGSTGFRELSGEEIKASFQAAEEAHRLRIEEKGHDCSDFTVHGYDPKSALRDYYYCGRCGDLLQVG